MTTRLEVTSTTAITSVDEADWDALAGDDNPFVEHVFLRSLEETGCVGAEAGWLPAHVLVWSVDGDVRTLVGAAPTYVKDNSYGEYIFDWGWADASQRAGLPYYPKVVVAVPFTPATGPRLLVHPDAPWEAVVDALVAGARAVMEQASASSLHWLFTTEREHEALAARGFLPRLSYQFHWHDDGYDTYDDFLAALRHKRRKEIKRERRKAQGLGLELAVEDGASLSNADLDALHACYRSTLDDRWAIPYLRRHWYQRLNTSLGHRAKVVTARRDGALVAGALAFHKGRHLYGRYWGALDELPLLHFEACYHRLVDWAIAHDVTRVEAGAQGEHKLTRGFMPSLCYSAHELRHPGLSDAVERFLDGERGHVRKTIAAYAEHSPFKRDQESS